MAALQHCGSIMGALRQHYVHCGTSGALREHCGSIMVALRQHYGGTMAASWQHHGIMGALSEY